MHNFLLNGADTDSIMFSKSDGAAFSEKEQEQLLEELNSLFEKGINWEHDGIYLKVIYLKAKNYIMWDGKKLKTKGSSIRDQKKELALRSFLDEIIWSIIKDEPKENLVEIYDKYLREAMNISEIKKWCSKKTITDKVYTSTRTNETKVKDAIVGTDYKEADKIWVYFKEDETLGLMENFDGKYNKKRLLEKLFKTAQVFSSVLDTKTLFINYSLKRNEKMLDEKLK